MTSVNGFKQIQLAIYTKMPEPALHQLAQGTVERNAVRSATLLYRTLKEPDNLRLLPKDQFEGRLKADGKLKWGTRFRLAFCHWGNALVSRYKAFGETFQQRLRKIENPEPTSLMERTADYLEASELREKLEDKAIDSLSGRFKNWLGRIFGSRKSSKHDDHDSDGGFDSDGGD